MKLERHQFDDLVRDVIASLYDYAALETHPLIYEVFKPVTGQAARPSEYVRNLFVEAVEALKPPRKEFSPSAPEWRPYLILQRRYIEGLSLREVSDSLAISDRQLRRDQHRALQALSSLLWKRFFPDELAVGEAETEPQPEEIEDSQSFAIHREPLEARQIILGVYAILQPRLEAQGVCVTFDFPDPLPAVLTDRVVFRQVLIHLWDRALNVSGTAGEWHLAARLADLQVILDLSVPVCGVPRQLEEAGLLTLRSWCERIGAQVDEVCPAFPAEGCYHFILQVPRADQKIVLVVDDQAPAISLFRRYLAQDGFSVLGLSDAGQALQRARQLQPVVITLDVMMPQMDGWEVLQKLKLDDETRLIPVIVCSAWGDPDLAISLGAAEFLKKPVTQKALLQAIQRLELI